MLFRSAESLAVNVISNFISDCAIFSSQIVACEVACVASFSVRFRSKEQGTRVKDRAKNGTSKRAEMGWPRPVFLCSETKWKRLLRRLLVRWLFSG